MSMTMLAGLAWMFLGLAVLGLGRLIEGTPARGYVRKHPDGDVDRYMRGQIRYKRAFTVVLIVAGAAVLIYGLTGGELQGRGNPTGGMSSTVEALVIAAMCVVAGTLMILLRDRFARSMMEMLRDFKTDISSEGLRRVCSIAMALTPWRRLELSSSLSA